LFEKNGSLHSDGDGTKGYRLPSVIIIIIMLIFNGGEPVHYQERKRFFFFPTCFPTLLQCQKSALMVVIS